MLRQLAIRNVVLVETLELEFERGLGVLTGETGAGKSILLDALGLALGARADAGAVRSLAAELLGDDVLVRAVPHESIGDYYRAADVFALASLREGFGLAYVEALAHGLPIVAHATPEETWNMFRASGAERLLPIHHSTFPLGDEHMDEPMQRLLAAAGGDAHRVIRAGPGDVWAA
jgi:predicted ATPase